MQSPAIPEQHRGGGRRQQRQESACIEQSGLAMEEEDLTYGPLERRLVEKDQPQDGRRAGEEGLREEDDHDGAGRHLPADQEAKQEGAEQLPDPSRHHAQNIGQPEKPRSFVHPEHFNLIVQQVQQEETTDAGSEPRQHLLSTWFLEELCPANPRPAINVGPVKSHENPSFLGWKKKMWDALNISFGVFAALNIMFLLGTAIWFRLVHASKKNRSRFEESMDDSIEELQWMYSLRSNLLLSTVVLSTYLLAIGEVMSLVIFFGTMGLVNVLTDWLCVYDVALFPIARTGHRVAALVCIVAMAIYIGVRYGVASQASP